MEFLTNAIFSDETREFLGALITRFDPDDYCSRAEVKLYTLDDLKKEITQLQPRGFRFEANGVLTADTSVRTTLSSNVMSFVEAECKHLGKRDFDVIDLVLYGVQHGGATIVNASSVIEGTEEPRLIPFINYRVSESSLNIYGACKMEDGSFRTHSMLEMEDGGAKTTHCVFPKDVDMAWANSFCKPMSSVTIGGTDMIIYAVDSHLSTFYTGVGEAFLNYLAFNVAYYNVGRKLIKALSPAVKDEYVKDEDREETVHVRRVVEKNVSIKHDYDKLCLEELTKCLGDNERLNNYLEVYPEANLTLHWLNKIFESPWYKDGEGSDEERTRTACAHMLMECKEWGLKYGLELLSHRYYLTVVDSFEDTTPMILKGGGVSGGSLKRVYGR